MLSDLELKAIVESSKTVEELREKLERSGVKRTNSPQQIRKFVYSLLERVNKSKLDELVAKEFPDTTELPCTKVVIDNVSYCIHGILHGQEPYGLFSSQKYKDFISSEIARFHNPPEEDYLLESHFSTMFGGDKSREMDDMPFAIFCLSRKQKLMLRLKYELQKWRYSSNNFKKAISPDYLKEFCAALEDPKRLGKTREISKLVRGIPEPLHSSLQRSTDGVYGKFNYTRSMWMAARIFNERRLYNSRVEKVHAIVGLAHESEIVYYLQNKLE